ncbi:condensin subunit 1, putative [Trypanosoma brucei gambiense DAL972]|uniref:Condensin subunit 1, putative n=1 Tax=Trypanosoma brucei gambiense (strain MHOM/CI/86/DAL972) TaxID=679716 RepID=C9ZXP0_TRYB9|nr:condensin subunit 1, putative [Trypanosoma brucei gambiense DAL972]CBH14185.1 condensin subunit 1, putative [Trypanosoma brucei gambiense DAL972]|eukprot:XP_011776455.1 condensin subunit 1, putative [Trypanosoma brucei gambiense DAL972]
MSDLLEFFVPAYARDLENIEKVGVTQYHISEPCDFDVPPRQQLDDLTRLFDSLHREKSPTALFSKPELFAALFTYIKAMEDKETSFAVTRGARHKICHESAERLKKLLQICVTYLRRNAENGFRDSLLLCLRSNIKMYVFVLCNTLLSTAPGIDDDEGMSPSFQRTGRKRKRNKGNQEAGIGEDDSGVDQDGREQALSALIDVFSQDILQLWTGELIEESMLTLMLRMLLHMITQKCNIHADVQSVSGALVVLLSKISAQMMARGSIEPNDFVSPMIELVLKSEVTALFFTRFVAETENEGASANHAGRVVTALIEGVAGVALYDVVGDPSAAKNVALFFSEVARRCVSVTSRMSDIVMQTINSESYEVRKSIITCVTEMVIQRYSGPNCNGEGEEEIRDGYLSELLCRLMDCNPYVRNHVVHMWEKLLEARAVPKRFRLPLTGAIVGRLEDRNYLVRDSALQVVVSILNKSWFGSVLSPSLLEEKIREATAAAEVLFESVEMYVRCLEGVRKSSTFTEPQASGLAEEATGDVPVPIEMSSEQESAIDRVISFEASMEFAKLIAKSLTHATSLLDSRTERDAIEAIKLVVACNRHRIDEAEKAFLRVLVMVYEGEIKIQYAVRDALVDVVFNAFSRSTTSLAVQNTASAHKLISFLRGAKEGDISAVDRVFALIRTNPPHWRLISGHFIDALWGIAGGALDGGATLVERRIAMRLFSIVCKHDWHALVSRKESVVEFLKSGTMKDNVVLAYCLKSLEVEGQDPHYQPISSKFAPGEHVILEQLVFHLCRTTTTLSSWLIVADAAISAVHRLCEVPAVVYIYVLEYLAQRVDADVNTQAQLFFVLGRTALKQLVAVDCLERQHLKRVDVEAMAKKPATEQSVVGDADAMHKELGLGSHEYRRHAIQELAQRRKQAIMSEGSIWHRLSKDVVDVCRKKASRSVGNPLERVCAVMTMSELMIVSDQFCEQHLDLLFTIVSDKRESWVVKTNAVIALGDLACVHPNLLSPYLKVPTTGFFKLLNDADVRVRAVTIQVCSHLVLGEMLRIRDHLYIIVRLVADPNETIASNAVTFVQNLALKEKERTGNLIPPLVVQLSHVVPADKFQLAMRSLLERVEGDKPTESLIERLCQRFEPYSERGTKKRQIARNLAFCLHELTYATERTIKRITSEVCYQQYKQWLRDDVVLDYFKDIAAKAKKVGLRIGTERRDKAAIEEWEARMQADCCGLDDPRGSRQLTGDESREAGDQNERDNWDTTADGL